MLHKVAGSSACSASRETRAYLGRSLETSAKSQIADFAVFREDGMAILSIGEQHVFSSLPKFPNFAISVKVSCPGDSITKDLCHAML